MFHIYVGLLIGSIDRLLFLMWLKYLSPFSFPEAAKRRWPRPHPAVHPSWTSQLGCAAAPRPGRLDGAQSLGEALAAPQPEMERTASSLAREVPRKAVLQHPLSRQYVCSFPCLLSCQMDRQLFVMWQKYLCSKYMLVVKCENVHFMFYGKQLPQMNDVSMRILFMCFQKFHLRVLLVPT